MKNSVILKRAAVHALGVLAYILLLAAFMNRANSWFGEKDQEIIAPVGALMLLVFSALLTGGLVLGKPLMLYLDGQKKEAVKMLVFTGLSLFVLLLLVFATLAIMK